MTDSVKITWLEIGHNTLIATIDSQEPPPSRGIVSGLFEKDMDQIQAWCWETNIGKRMSFDTFKFRTKEEITAFLLKWG
jgi:hypothetical protein